MFTLRLALSRVLLLFFSGTLFVFSRGQNVSLERFLVSISALFWRGHLGGVRFFTSEDVWIVLHDLCLLLNNFGESGERGVRSPVVVGIIRDFFLPFGGDELR